MMTSLTSGANYVVLPGTLSAVSIVRSNSEIGTTAGSNVTISFST
jgi:hypothetical protein